MSEYVQCGIGWEKEVSKLPKPELIKMIRKLIMGTVDRKLCEVNTLKQANRAVEGIVNDFEAGIIDKPEAMRLFGEYTGRIMGIFWDNAKERIKENTELLK